MKTFKRGLAALILFMGLFTIPASANPLKYPVLVGEVVKVEECKDGPTKVLVCGYLNGCDIYKGEVCVLVDKDTKISMGCEKEDKKCDNIKCQEGDLVSIALDKKMTKSVPPQVNAKRIKITKCNKHKKGEEKKEETRKVEEAKENTNAEEKVEEKVEEKKENE